MVTNTELNKLKIFTLTMKASEGKRTKHHTWPLAMCFKKKLTHDIFINLLQEIYYLQHVLKKYWRKEKQLHETICFINMVSNDLPERCYNTGISLIGICTHCWGHSCKYEDNWTPSCKKCEIQRMENILSGKEDVPNCTKCSDWWSPVNTFTLRKIPLYIQLVQVNKSILLVKSHQLRYLLR